MLDVRQPIGEAPLDPCDVDNGMAGRGCAMSPAHLRPPARRGVVGMTRINGDR
jgi:hypothetical protein